MLTEEPFIKTTTNKIKRQEEKFRKNNAIRKLKDKFLGRNSIFYSKI
ncbi:MAG: hypothetical protein V8R82_11470 [Clostridia bacterium]